MKPEGLDSRQDAPQKRSGSPFDSPLPCHTVNQLSMNRTLPCSICWLYFVRVASVRPEKQQSIKFGFNVSKLGFAFWENSKYTSTYLGKESMSV